MMGCPSGLSERAVTDEGVDTGVGVWGMGAGGAGLGTSVMMGVVAGGLGAGVSVFGAGGALVGTSGWPSLFSVMAVMVGETGGADVSVDVLGTG